MNIYTQKCLEEMSDKRLNVIAQHWTNNDGGDLTCPCSNWRDCGKLIDEMKECNAILSLGTSINGEFAAYTSNSNSFVIDQPHKRAVAVAYILVKQHKDSESTDKRFEGQWK